VLPRRRRRNRSSDHAGRGALGVTADDYEHRLYNSDAGVIGHTDQGLWAVSMAK